MPSYLGQNFLKDSTYTIFIAQQVAILSQKYDIHSCIEIGPGKGALTKKLVSIVDKPLILLEKDETLKSYLETLFPSLTHTPPDTTISQIDNGNQNYPSNNFIQLLMGDALALNTAGVLEQNGRNAKKTIVVGNLPYYITSPLITKFFGGGNAQFPVGVFMVQKEVADKIRTDADKKSFLWRLLNYQYDVKYLKTVPAKAFSPAPKVQSAIFSLIEKPIKPQFSYEKMIYILDKISKYKRKTLGKCWKMADLTGEYTLPEDIATKRLEEIGLEEMGRIIGK